MKGKTGRLFGTYLLLGLCALVFLLPVLFLFVTALKENEMQIIGDMGRARGFLPYGDLGLQNVRDVFSRVAFGRHLWNSVFIVATTVGVGLIVNSMLAFSLARLHFRGRRLIVAVIVALLIIPIEAVVIPMLLLVNTFGWIDTYLVQIIPFIADAFFIFLMYQFFIGLPKDLDEAAIIDGASYFTIYSRITLPLSGPVLASVAILQSNRRWDEFLWPLMVTRVERYRPLTVAVQAFFTLEPKQWGDIFAFAAMMTLPILAVFLIFQKKFVLSAAGSGIKG